MTSRQLRAALNRLGISQSEAARQLNVNNRTVRKWVAGDLPVPRTVELIMDCWLHHGALSVTKPRKEAK